MASEGSIKLDRLGVVSLNSVGSGIVLGCQIWDSLWGSVLTVIKVQVTLFEQKLLFPQFFSKFDAIFLPDR